MKQSRTCLLVFKLLITSVHHPKPAWCLSIEEYMACCSSMCDTLSTAFGKSAFVHSCPVQKPVQCLRIEERLLCQDKLARRCKSAPRFSLTGLLMSAPSFIMAVVGASTGNSCQQPPPVTTPPPPFPPPRYWLRPKGSPGEP